MQLIPFQELFYLGLEAMAFRVEAALLLLEAAANVRDFLLERAHRSPVLCGLSEWYLAQGHVGDIIRPWLLLAIRGRNLIVCLPVGA